MDGKELVAAFTAKSDEAAGFKIELAATKTVNEGLVAANTKLTADLETERAAFAEFKKTATNSAEVEAALKAAQDSAKEMKEAADKVLPHVKAALVASGVAETDLSEKSLVEMLTVVEEKGLKLHQIITPGGVSAQAKDDATLKASADASRSEAFKTAKQR